MIYEHKCRECDHEWEEVYSLDAFMQHTAINYTFDCPWCESEDTYRCVSAVPTHFKGGGWSPQGYYKNEAYDKHVAEGKSVKLYDNKEDIDRDMKGEAEVAERVRLKTVDGAARKHLGPDAGLTQKEADTQIQAAGEKALKR
jgi:predicted nucleic acid-binding Zn ribbon protein